MRAWRGFGVRGTLATLMSNWRELAVRGVRASLSGVFDLCLPTVCAACGSMVPSEKGMCTNCNVDLLRLVSLPYCPRCGTTLGPNIPPRADGCAGCDTVLPRFAKVVRLGPYTGPLRIAIRQLKYHRREDLLRPLGRLLQQAVRTHCPDEAFDLVLSVPMHWQRRVARGYDHARVLGSKLARALDLPLGDELIRTRNTPPQVYLPRSQREKNVRGAFAVARPRDIEGTNILLVDDVTTTGATANEASRTLLKSGANRVTLAVIAKSEPPTAYTQHWKN